MTIDEQIARANDSARSTEERVEAAWAVWQDHPERLGELSVSPEIISSLGRQHGPYAALAVARASRGYQREELLHRAIALWPRDREGEEPLTTALIALGDGKRALKSLVDEFRQKNRDKVRSPMFAAAWGLHLLEVFEALGESTFDRFVRAVHDIDDVDAGYVLSALEAAPVGDERKALKARLTWLFDEIAQDWLIQRFE